jgi:hypothetical protein
LLTWAHPIPTHVAGGRGCLREPPTRAVCCRHFRELAGWAQGRHAHAPGTIHRGVVCQDGCSAASRPGALTHQLPLAHCIPIQQRRHKQRGQHHRHVWHCTLRQRRWRAGRSGGRGGGCGCGCALKRGKVRRPLLLRRRLGRTGHKHGGCLLGMKHEGLYCRPRGERRARWGRVRSGRGGLWHRERRCGGRLPGHGRGCSCWAGSGKCRQRQCRRAVCVAGLGRNHVLLQGVTKGRQRARW